MKALMAAIMVLFLVAPALAVQEQLPQDVTCQDRGFDYAIGAFSFNGETWGQIWSDESIEVMGDSASASWSSEANIAGVIGIEECLFQVVPGDQDMISEEDSGLAYLYFCGDYEQDPEVPEFSTIFAGVALVGAVAGFLLVRSRK